MFTFWLTESLSTLLQQAHSKTQTTYSTTSVLPTQHPSIQILTMYFYGHTNLRKVITSFLKGTVNPETPTHLPCQNSPIETTADTLLLRTSIFSGEALQNRCAIARSRNEGEAVALPGPRELDQNLTFLCSDTASAGRSTVLCTKARV